MASIPRSIGKYRVLEEISSGSFGRVFRGEDTSRQNYPIAIKLMQSAHLASLQERSSFLQEAQLLTMLRHPYIVPVLDVGIEEEIPYLVMEYAPNGSLYDRLRALAPRPLPVRDALVMLVQVGTALQYAHQQNVIHRDLKPANILFNARGDALLADFGIATMLASSMKSGTVVGTPYFMAPEQFRGTISKEGDQYALGCIAYQALTGRLPFDAPDFFALGFKHMSEASMPPTQLNLLIPYPVEAAIMKAIAKERTQRFPDVQSFVAALEVSLPSFDPLPTPSATPAPISPVTPLPSTGEIPVVAHPMQAGGYDHTVVPRRYIEEEGKAPSYDRPARPGVKEEEGQPAFPARAYRSGEGLTTPAMAREVEGQSPTPTNPPTYLVNAPSQAEVMPSVLPHENPGVITPYHGAMAWHDQGHDEQEDIPTVLNASSASRSRVKEERTLPAEGAAIGMGMQTPSPKYTDGYEQRVNGPVGMVPVGGSIPPGAQTWPDSPPAPQKKRRRGSPFLIAAIIALVIALLGGGVLYAMTGIIQHSSNKTLGQGQVQSAGPAQALSPGTAQANITPRQTLIDKTYSINAILGTPNSANQQVQARSLSSSSATQSATVSATGKSTTPAKEATGYIYLKNLLTTTSIAFSANVHYFTVGSDSVYLSQAITLQHGASATMAAYVTPAGANGNIAAGSINGNYSCTNGVKNCYYAYNYAFSGGSNSSSYTYVTQSDVSNANNQAVSQYASGETSTANSNVQGQMSSNEQMFNGINCSQHLSDNQAANSRASSVTAFISEACSAEVYDSSGAQSLAQSLLQNFISRTSGEKLVGKITANVISVSGGSNGTIVLQVEAKGSEVSTFSETQLQSLKALIAGKSVQDAEAILDKQPGVSKALVTLGRGNGQTLPEDTKNIIIVVV